MRRGIRHSKRERGQTIVLVAVSLFALLSMAALAIDVTTLYVASTEAQQAADSAALAGAKVFVTSGYTSYPTNFATTDWLCNGSTGLADYAAQSALGANTVAGVIPTMTTSCDFTHHENPTITVQVKRTALPVFFAKIWGASSPQTSATATAEAYNPSGNSNQTPIQVAGVKPWLLANCDPTGSTPSPSNSNCIGNGAPFPPFVDPTDGHIENGGSFIGHTITLNISNGGQLNECNPSGGGGPCPGFSTPTMDFYPLDIPENPPTPLCAGSAQPSCGNPHGIYYDSIACFNPTTFTCGQSVNGPADSVWIDSRITTGSLKPRTDQATQCLIHESGFGALPAADCSGGPYNQDCFVVQGAGKPVLITPGQLNPDQPLRPVQYISRSDSVATVALFDGSNLCNASNICTQVTATKIVGFLQLGIQTNVNTGSVQAVILNASGCNSTVSGQPVAGGNISPIPVRLVQTP